MCYKKEESVMPKSNESNVLTKECIVTALLRLMQTKKYDSISITDITNLAGVSRMAYYRNYKSKDEILIKRLEEEEKKLIDDINGEKAENLRVIIAYISVFFQENALVIKAVYDAGLAHLLSNMLSRRIYDYFPVASRDPKGKYAVHFYVGAVFSVFRLWFDNGMKESVDDIVDIIYKLINNDSAIDFLVLPEEENK